jgi:hypothetical protein
MEHSTLCLKSSECKSIDRKSSRPSFERLTTESIARAYRPTRVKATEETGLDDNAFPATCPYSFEDITARQFSL